jgi:hypothetical protein
MIRRWHIKDILVGLLVMILSVIVLAITLGAVLFISKREIAIGPLYLLIPIVTFIAGFYWSWRRSSRPKVPPKPPATITIIVKSTTVGFTAMIVSAIVYLMWIRFWVLRNDHGFVSIDVHALLYWPVLLPVFLAAFFLEYRRALRRRSMLTGGMTH